MMLFKLLKDSKGATAIEYALIASLIAVVAISGMKAIGGSVRNQLNLISNELRTVESDANTAINGGGQ